MATPDNSRYRGRVRYYQIWNEPNLVREWGQVSARDYVALLKIAYTRAKEADPDCVIITVPDDQPTIQGAIDAAVDGNRILVSPVQNLLPTFPV